MSEAGFDPSEPRAEEDMHTFSPRGEAGLADREILASCTCGWVGSAHPVTELGYEEAQAEHRQHVSGELPEPEAPS